MDWMMMAKVAWPLLLLLGALIVGSLLEKRHYASILKREAQLHHIVVVVSRFPSEQFGSQFLVTGSVVVSSDYFRRTLAMFRQIFAAM